MSEAGKQPPKHRLKTTRRKKGSDDIPCVEVGKEGAELLVAGVIAVRFRIILDRQGETDYKEPDYGNEDAMREYNEANYPEETIYVLGALQIDLAIELARRSLHRRIARSDHYYPTYNTATEGDHPVMAFYPLEARPVKKVKAINYIFAPSESEVEDAARSLVGHEYPVKAPPLTW